MLIERSSRRRCTVRGQSIKTSARSSLRNWINVFPVAREPISFEQSRQDWINRAWLEACELTELEAVPLRGGIAEHRANYRECLCCHPRGIHQLWREPGRNGDSGWAYAGVKRDSLIRSAEP
jgi:hypothetical protein